MKRGNLLKRVNSNRDTRGRHISSGGGAVLSMEDLKALEKYKPCNTPTKLLLGAKQNKVENRGLFSRFVNRRKKAQLTMIQQQLQQLECHQRLLPCSTPPKPQRRLESATPVTLDTETGTEVELPLSIPCERVPSYAETTQTYEISDFSGPAEDELLEKRARSFKRVSSAATPSTRMILDTSALPLGKSRSMRLARTTGNESLGDVKPNLPRRGTLPPILGDGEESVGESSCSGITMDFTYEEMKTPMLQPVGRLGEGVPQTRGRSFVPPTYITMEDENDDLDLPMFGDV